MHMYKVIMHTEIFCYNTLINIMRSKTLILQADTLTLVQYAHNELPGLVAMTSVLKGSIFLVGKHSVTLRMWRVARRMWSGVP